MNASLSIILVSIYFSLAAMGDTKDIFKIMSQDAEATAVSIKLNSGRIITLTNAHMCDGNKFVLIPNAKHKIAIVIRQSTLADLCELTSISDTGYKLSNAYEKGNSVTVIGYPLGSYRVSTGLLGMYSIFSKSIVAKNKFFGDIYVDYTGPVNEGSSGSPALNNDNEIVGLLALVNGNGTKGQLVPLEFIKQFLGEL